MLSQLPMNNSRGASRGRIALGLAGAIVGTAWAVGDMAEVRAAAQLGLILVPLLLVVLGVVRALRLAMPAGTVAGPVVLLGAAGVASFAAAMDLPGIPDPDKVGAAVLVLGGVAVALSRHRDHSMVEARVRRYRATLLSTVPAGVTGESPAKLVIRALLGGVVKLDLSGAEYPAVDRIMVDITIIFGRVELTIPANWTAQAGRIELAHRVDFSGPLDTTEIAPVVPEQDDIPRVVVNVQGLGGAVALFRTG
jgi:hypothetical protein